MATFYNILSSNLGNLLIGILITLICIALIFYLINSWHKNRAFTSLSYIIGVFLFFALFYHTIIICGAISIKSCGDELKNLVNEYVHTLSNKSNDIILSNDDLQAIIERLRDQFPLIGFSANLTKSSGDTALNIAESINDEMQCFMNEYIVKHLLWSLFFIIVGAFCIIKTMEKGCGYGGRKVYTRPEEQF